MYKVCSFSAEGQYKLEGKINEFIIDKGNTIRVINVNYSTTMVGYTVKHYALLCYEES